jgi:hypothetical protein
VSAHDSPSGYREPEDKELNSEHCPPGLGRLSLLVRFCL